MKAATVSQLKKELTHLPQSDLVELCLRCQSLKKKIKSS